MKSHLILTLLLLVTATVAFCQDKKPVMMRGAKLGEPKPPVTTMIVGVNETVGSIAEPGWLIVVSAALLPEEGATPAAVPSNLKVKMTDEKDKEVILSFEAVPPPANSDEEPKFYWLAEEAATKSLSPGRYRITLVPDKGELKGLRIESGDLRVVEADPARNGLLGSLKIQRSLLLGKIDEAIAEAERLTTADAENEDAWIAKGDILMMQDKPDEALKAYDSALALHKDTDSEPLFILERQRAAFFRSLEKRGVIPLN
jgi:hypothetical protein